MGKILVFFLDYGKFMNHIIASEKYMALIVLLGFQKLIKMMVRICHRVIIQFHLYKEELARTLECLRGFSSIPHLEITDLHEGDVIKTLPRLLNRYPSTMFALCYFDLDIYKPTKVCLEHVYKRMPKGGVIAFDELNDQDVPGETVAFFEVLGDENITVRGFRRQRGRAISLKALKM